jgi:hypothetical protein
MRSNVASEYFLVYNYGYIEEEFIDGIGSYLHGDFNCFTPEITREMALRFAKDISEGLLDEIAEFLEKSTHEMNNGIEMIIKKQDC